MKKGYVYTVIFLIIIVLAIIVGIILYKTMDKPQNKVENETVTNKVEISQQQTNKIENTTSININSEQEKVSPKASLVLEKHYEGCDHTIKQYLSAPEEMINMTKEEVEEKYADWVVEKFSPLEVIVLKQEEGMCNQHYVLRQKDGKIVVYRIEHDGKEILKEETGISTEYLTQTDLLKIQQGIKVYGDEQLNSTLEDFE